MSYVLPDFLIFIDDYADGRGDYSLEREGSTRGGDVREGSIHGTSVTEETSTRSFSRGSSARSTGPKSPTDRPPAYGAKGAGSYVVEETITTKGASKFESSASDTGYDSRIGRTNALEVKYHEGEGKIDNWSLKQAS